MEKDTKKKTWLPVSILIIVILLTIIGTLFVSQNNKKQEQEEVITVSTLKKIIHVSELSTFTAVYNGIAQVMNEEKPEETDYYVSYEAKVNAGIDFEKINIMVDATAKTIHITLPEVYITETIVDIASLDFIFMNEQANTSTISQKAYKECEADVQNESKKQDAIFQLAKQNAENILTALVKPMIEQLDSEYKLIFD